MGEVADPLHRPKRSFAPKHQFRVEEDRQILSLIEELNGVPDWNFIAGRLANRNPRQCRERWHQYLRCDNLKETGWTADEDIVLEREVREHGTKWSLISLFLPGRSQVKVKNRWVQLCRMNGKLSGLVASAGSVSGNESSPSDTSNDGRDCLLTFPTIEELLCGGACADLASVASHQGTA
jgi:hypothetical protein